MMGGDERAGLEVLPIRGPFHCGWVRRVCSGRQSAETALEGSFVVMARGGRVDEGAYIKVQLRPNGLPLPSRGIKRRQAIDFQG